MSYPPHSKPELRSNIIIDSPIPVLLLCRELLVWITWEHLDPKFEVEPNSNFMESRVYYLSGRVKIKLPLG